MRHLGRLALAGLLMSGLALAQKPPPSNAPQAPTAAKPPPAPAPAPGPGPAPSGKPDAPPATPAPAPSDKFAGPSLGPSPAPEAAPPPTAVPGVPAPLDEPTAVGRLRRLLGPDATLTYGNVEVTDPARGTVRLSGVTITADDTPTRIETLTLDDLRDDGLGEADARNLTRRDGDTSLSIERAQVAGLTVRAPAPGEPRQPDLVTLDSLRFEGVRVQDGDASDFRLAQAALEDYGPGRQSRISLSGLELRLKPGEWVDQVRLERAVLRGMDLATIGTAAANDQPLPLAGRFTLELEDMAASHNGQPVGSLGSLRMSSDQPESGTGTGTLALRALRVDPMPGLDRVLQGLGYPFLLFDLTADSRYDPASGRLELTSLSLAGRDLATLALAMTLDGAGAEALLQQDFSDLRLVSAGLRLIDQSLFSRVLAQQSRERQIPAAQLRQQYASIAAGALSAPALTAVREAVQRFIRGQAQEVELTLRPPRPVALQELQQNPPANPAEAAQRLGLGAVAR
jgi:hypothetical protein